MYDLLPKINSLLSASQMITEVWQLEFDEGKNVFTAMKTGRMIIWDADKSELIFGNRSYIKKL